MIDDIKTQALEIQLARIGPNCRWEDILPASMGMQELLQYTDFTVGKLKKTGEILVTFNMALGRLMTIASERPAADWATTPYKNFTEYQDVALEPIAKHGTRFTAMRIFKELNGIPIEDLEKCPIGNLNEIARQSEKRNLSDSQREDLLKAAAIMTNSELKDMMEKKGVVPEGEARTKSFLFVGAEADIDYLISWLKRKDVREACGDQDLGKIMAAMAEFDAAGPSSVHASVLLSEIYNQGHLPDNSEIWNRVAQWAGGPPAPAIDVQYQDVTEVPEFTRKQVWNCQVPLNFRKEMTKLIRSYEKANPMVSELKITRDGKTMGIEVVSQETTE